MMLMSAQRSHCFVNPLLPAMADALDPSVDVDLAHESQSGKPLLLPGNLAFRAELAAKHADADPGDG